MHGWSYLSMTYAVTNKGYYGRLWYSIFLSVVTYNLTQICPLPQFIKYVFHIIICCNVHVLYIDKVPPTPHHLLYLLIPPIRPAAGAVYQLACSTMFIKGGPLKTCTAGTSFIIKLTKTLWVHNTTSSIDLCSLPCS